MNRRFVGLAPGNTFDGWDFVAYVIGTGVALMWDVRLRRAAPPRVAPA